GPFLLMGDLGLVPDLAVGGSPHIDAAVVAALALDLAEAPLDVEDAIAGFAIVAEDLLDADTVATPHVGGGIDAPRVLGVELLVRRDRHARPALEVLAGEDVDPAGRVGLKSALGSGLGRLGDNEPGQRQRRQGPTHPYHHGVLLQIWFKIL